jgi:predicted RNase H-related nuclease YkuK (DUF458 family)
MIPPSYKPLSEKKLRKFYGDEISYNDFVKLAKDLESEGLNLYIGTDSQEFNKTITVVTCIAFYKNGIPKSSIFYFKDRISRKSMPNLKARMTMEAFQSVQVAMEMGEIYSGEIEVHLDIGYSEKRSKTFLFKKELEQLVESQGYKCETKPNSWASSTIADRLSKVE